MVTVVVINKTYGDLTATLSLGQPYSEWHGASLSLQQRQPAWDCCPTCPDCDAARRKRDNEYRQHHVSRAIHYHPRGAESVVKELGFTLGWPTRMARPTRPTFRVGRVL